MSLKTLFNGTYQDIEELAQSLREKVDEAIKASGEKRISVRDLLRWTVSRFNGRIAVIESPSDPESGGGSLVVYDKANFVIWVSPYASPFRTNFTLAHELGHYLLHYDHKGVPGETPVIYERFGSDEYEWQANRFAAAFLMPKRKFVEYYRKVEGDIVLLSGHFEVSPSAVEVRIKSLQLA